MKIANKLAVSFAGVALMIGIVGYSSLGLTNLVRRLKTVELPMKRHLRQIETGMREAMHDADAFLITADAQYADSYNEQAAAIEQAHSDYLKLADRPHERENAKKLKILWDQAKAAGDEILELTKKLEQSENNLFEYVDKADDVIDFEIQEKFSPADSNLLEKEQALREVEVSIWEAIHAAEQYMGLTEDIERAGHKQKTFAELMEKQFRDVDEFWAKYTALAGSETEIEAKKEFERLWAKAMASGRDTIRLYDRARDKYGIFSEKIRRASEILKISSEDSDQEKIAGHNATAIRLRTQTIVATVIALFWGIFTCVVISRSICRPIEKLKKSAAEIGAGNLDTPIDVVTNDEIGQLADSLKNMAKNLKQIHTQLVQSEKLASIGQLAAGVAHEMNTPVGFVASNFETLESYIKKIRNLLAMYGEFIEQIEHLEKTELQSKIENIGQHRDDMKIDFILEDIQELFNDSKEGLDRVTTIVRNLRDFSRIDQPGSRDEYDLNKGIEATLTVARNAIKYDADVITDFSELPVIYCQSGQINQVFLNILVNAAQAIKEQKRNSGGTITIRTYAADNEVTCEISDDGPGIPPDKISRIFEPFFTTKPVGKGTGLGLSVSYDIITNKHNGKLFVDSTVGKGTKFTIKLPIGTKENSKKEKVNNGTKNSIIY
ncbi:MAG: HAMP domain-containing protein [Sedimentisphaerales bacterium]|nr:HAMP domain-containing protein [Sedimentisphaerales bacterium]